MSINELFRDAVAHRQAGRLQQAESVGRQILQLQPDHPAALHFLGVIALQVGRNDIAAELIARAISIKPDYTEARFNLAIAFANQGRLDDAVASYRNVVAALPDHADAHYNLGAACHRLGRLDDAVASYREALRLRPAFAQAHNNLGIALQDRGLLAEAVACFHCAIDQSPGNAETCFNLANALKEQGKLDDAIAAYRQALAINADFPEAWDNLGVALHETDLLDEAIACHRRALQLRPDWAETLANLAVAFQEQGRQVEALDSCLRALEIRETPEIRTAFAHCMKALTVATDAGRIRPLLIRALAEPWARPGDLVEAALSYIKLDGEISGSMARAAGAWPQRLSLTELFGDTGLAATCNDELLRVLLENVPSRGVELEQFLTTVRHALLVGIAPGTTVDSSRDGREAMLSFHCALARQCFNNEYVFSCTDEEAAEAENLREQILVALASQSPISAGMLAAVACYFPLADMAGAGNLLMQPWPAAVNALLEQQVRAPMSERECRAHVHALTAIEDSVSRLVRDQYEENPYPRWVKCAPFGKVQTLNAFLRRQFPHTSFRLFDEARTLDVLVAGCGTGQHSIESAQQYRNARVLAIDLSLSSICYAQRKTREMGIANLDYAQADIMQLGAIGRQFDIIESVGVLHHMQDPLAGWRVLRSLLRDGGFMRLGLYSEHARRAVVAARKLIAEKGCGTSAAEIRRFRQYVMSPDAGPELTPLLKFRDFFGTSECRDLLFHVQEHRYTMLDLKDCLARLDLRLMGFSLDFEVMRQYAARFPEDVSRTNLDSWNTFEIDYPDTFAGMYQFWVQKPS